MVSDIVTKGIMSSQSNVIIYQKIKDNWSATVYYQGKPLLTTLDYVDIDEVADDVISLIKEKTGEFLVKDWVVYGKRLSDTDTQRFNEVSHWHCTQNR